MRITDYNNPGTPSFTRLLWLGEVETRSYLSSTRAQLLAELNLLSAEIFTSPRAGEVGDDGMPGNQRISY